MKQLGWGRLKSLLNRIVIAGNSVCWEWQGSVNAYGYGYVNYSEFPNLVHRLMWMLHNHMEIPHGGEIRHECDNPKCVNPHHLVLSTHADNMRDMAKKGRSLKRKGEKNPNSKLTDRDVREIKEELANGRKRKEVAGNRKISLSTIDRIINGISWKHI